MTRPSLATPLAVILAGGALLAANLHPRWSAGAVVADGWPWLLAVWGVFRCGESVWARLRRRPPPAPAEGGALLVAVLVAALGSAAHAVRSPDAHWFGWRWRLGGFDRHFTPLAERRLAAAPLLELKELRGRLAVTAGPGPDVRIRGGWRTVRRDGDAAARALDARATPDAVVVQPGIAAWTGDEYRLEIEVPAAVRVRLVDCRGDIAVKGLRTDVQPAVQASLGRETRLRLADVAGGLTLESSVEGLRLADVRGPVRLEGNLIESIEAERVDGPFELISRTLRARWAALPGRFRLTRHEIELRGVSGPLELEARAARVVRLRDLSGAASLFARQAALELTPGPSGWTQLEARTERGDIRLALDPEQPFQLDASARGGRIDNRLSPEPSAGEGGRLELSTEQPGAPFVQLETDRGVIVLESRTAAVRR